jgi:hypothetical protein
MNKPQHLARRLIHPLVTLIRGTEQRKLRSAVAQKPSVARWMTNRSGVFPAARPELTLNAPCFGSGRAE